MKFLEWTLFFLHLCVTSSSTKTIADIDVPHLQLLATHLSLSECMTIVHYNINYVSSSVEGRQSRGQEDCFHRLVKWVCQLRTSAKHTFPIVRDALKDIGRDDLIASLESLTRRPVSLKVVRDVQAVGQAQDYEESSVSQVLPAKPKEETDSGKSTDTSNPLSAGGVTAGEGKSIAHTAIRITIGTAGIVLVSTIIVTCCCTLCVRRKLVNLCDRLFRRNRKPKSSKFLSVDTDEERSGSQRVGEKKERNKRKRAPSYQLVHGATPNDPLPHAESNDDSEEQATDCYRCYRKKRRKASKNPKK